MNYLQEIIAFTEYKVLNSLSAGQISLWFALMGINNKCGWREWFSVSNKVLEAHSGMTQKGIYKARDVLKGLGIIDFRYNGKKATDYKLKSVVLFEKNQGSTNYGTNSSSDYGTNNSSIEGTGFGTTLNKQNKTKQNKYYNNKSSLRKSPLNNYDDPNAEDYAQLEEEILDIMLEEA